MSVHRADRRLPANELDTDDQSAIAAPKLAVGASLDTRFLLYIPSDKDAIKWFSVTGLGLKFRAAAARAKSQGYIEQPMKLCTSLVTCQ